MAQSGSRNVRSRTTLDGPRWSGPLIAWVGFRHGGRLPELIVSLDVDPAIAGRVEPEECQGPYGGHWLPSADVAEEGRRDRSLPCDSIVADSIKCIAVSEVLNLSANPQVSSGFL